MCRTAALSYFKRLRIGKEFDLVSSRLSTWSTLWVSPTSAVARHDPSQGEGFQLLVESDQLVTIGDGSKKGSAQKTLSSDFIPIPSSSKARVDKTWKKILGSCTADESQVVTSFWFWMKPSFSLHIFLPYPKWSLFGPHNPCWRQATCCFKTCLRSSRALQAVGALGRPSDYVTCCLKLYQKLTGVNQRYFWKSVSHSFFDLASSVSPSNLTSPSTRRKWQRIMGTGSSGILSVPST